MKTSKLLLVISLLLISLSTFAQSGKSVSLRFGNMIIADRNVGAIHGGTARNYTNDKNHDDHKNKSFRGVYSTWDEALSICPAGWRLPTEAELEVIGNAMQTSNEGTYIEDGDGNRCYFPLPGSSDNPSLTYGFYWSSAEDVSGTAWGLRMSTHSVSVSRSPKLFALSVRCVKTVD